MNQLALFIYPSLLSWKTIIFHDYKTISSMQITLFSRFYDISTLMAHAWNDMRTNIGGPTF